LAESRFAAQAGICGALLDRGYGFSFFLWLELPRARVHVIDAPM
jgi:hypothetical protein